MGRKRRLISARHKFGNKHSAHPLISQDDVDTEEMGLSEEWDALASQKVKKRGRGGGTVAFKEGGTDALGRPKEGLQPDFVPPGHYVGLRGRVRRDPNFPSAPDRPM